MALHALDLFDCTAEDIFQQLVRKGNGGTVVRSTAAPALSTQFVKSKHTARVQANTDGAFVELSYPSHDELAQKHHRKHGQSAMFGYVSTYASDVLPAGSGERSARALAREENTYQLRGTFPSAALNFSKLKARVEAREGDVDAIENVFATFWGIPRGQVQTLPQLHIEGAEATRMSAMEDRAYHALSGHPGHHGGYRVDMATVASDALGENVPLNWPRIRTALKAIAMAQLQGDLSIAKSIHTLQSMATFRFYMDLVRNSQPRYQRPYQWENVVLALIDPQYLDQMFLRRRTQGTALSATNDDLIAYRIVSDEENAIQTNVEHIAKLVSSMSTQALAKAVEIMFEHDQERALVAYHDNEEYETLAKSQLSNVYEVPRYKLTRSSVNRGITFDLLGADKLPDITSHGRPKRRLDLAEFREAHMTMELDISGALNLAAYLTTIAAVSQPYVYMLMRVVPDPRDGFSTKAAVRLRREYLYDKDEVRSLGQFLLSDNFVNNLDLVIRNMTTIPYLDEDALKYSIWSYLSKRCKYRRSCPTTGGWRNLVIALRDMPEGWTLYYWMRVSIGKIHHVSSTGILAPISAGDTVDFLTLIIKGIRARARHWAAYYSAEYKIIEGRIAEQRKKSMTSEPDNDRITRYIPPHQRRLTELELTYDATAILSRSSGYKEEEYERMVEMQSKSKFFAAIEVFTHSSFISVGISDSKMHEMLVEFYQARWYSLHKRIERAKARGKVFYLGPIRMEEHPWGDLVTELPETYDDMLAFMLTLNQDAWTLPPDYLQAKFRKAISELWSDVSTEISELIEYLHEVESGALETQDQLIASRPETDPRLALLTADAIEIPVAGYTPPHMLPTKQSTVLVEGRPAQIPTETNAQLALAPPDDAEDDNFELDDDLGDDSFEDGAMFDQMSAMDDVIELTNANYLTYQKIWHLLALPDETDERKRVAFGLPYTTDLTSMHADSLVGPLVLVGEEDMIHRKWAKKRRLMMMRLGTAEAVVEDNDM